MPRTRSTVTLAVLAGVALPLVAVAAPESPRDPSGEGNPPVTTVAPPPAAVQGEALAEALGCGGCHAGLPASDLRERAPAFGPQAPAVTGDFVFTYLADPVPRRPELAPARMPDFGLRDDERLALALFLSDSAEGPSVTAAQARSPEITARDGELLFAGLGCGGCHTHPDVTLASASAVGPDLGRSGWRHPGPWLESFLGSPVPVRPSGHRPGTGSRMPDFRLESEEVSQLAAYLGTLRGGPAPRNLASSAGARIPDGASGSSLSPWARRRAEGYLTDRLSCLGCHSWRGDGGRVAPPLDGLPERLTPEAVAAAVHAPSQARPGSVMPPSLFRPGILDQVVALLASDTASWTPQEAVAVPWGERRGILEAWARDSEAEELAAEPLYGRRCASCHGVTGNGAGFNQPWLPVAATAHAAAEVISPRPDDTLYDGIASGGWVLDKSHRMPAFGQALDRQSIRGLVAYIRELCNCQGPDWATEGGDG